MLKKKFIVVLANLFVCCILFTGCAFYFEGMEEDVKQSLIAKAGQDLGNDRYEIFYDKYSVDGVYEYTLYDREQSESLENWILNFTLKDNKVYVIGLTGTEGGALTYDMDILTLEQMPDKLVYTVLDVENETYSQSEEIESFTEEEQKILEEILASDTLYDMGLGK